MSFRLNQSSKFSITVTVPIANEKGGFDKNTFVATFARAKTSDLVDLRTLTNDELVRKQLIDWQLRDEETKVDVPFTKENLDAILEIPPSPLHIATAFWEGMNGARVKN
jgi:hypothetical protein